MSAAAETRAQLVDAATRVFAEQGVQAASLLEVTRLAGQRNRGAVHYHFGSRDGILVAILDQHSGYLAHREAEVLEVARARPDDDVASVVEAIVRPTVELTEIDWRGACVLRILRDLVSQDPDTVDPAVQAAMERTGGVAVYELLTQRMAPLPAAIAQERLGLMTSFLLQSVADRAGARERTNARPQLPAEQFIANLVSMAAGMLAAPAPAVPTPDTGTDTDTATAPDLTVSALQG